MSKKLSPTELIQLIHYCKWAVEKGDYYGNKAHFWKRHCRIGDRDFNSPALFHFIHKKDAEAFKQLAEISQ